MEHHRDEHIVCGDCGTSFLFSAGEASVFAQRGLAAPKRCKECRRARKERAPFAGGQQASPGPDRNGNGYARPRGDRRGGPPRYTGDVNEYRSPMQDSFSPAPVYAGRWGDGPSASAPAAGGWGRRGGFSSGNQGGEDGARPARGDGEGAFARHGRPGPARGAPPRARRPQGDQGAASAAPATGPRRRAQAEMFSITCNACGTSAEVPFKPAEGREVFCQACYRARKPA